MTYKRLCVRYVLFLITNNYTDHVERNKETQILKGYKTNGDIVNHCHASDPKFS